MILFKLAYKKELRDYRGNFNNVCPFYKGFKHCTHIRYRHCKSCKYSKAYRFRVIFELLDDWAMDHIPRILYRIPQQVRDTKYKIKYFIQKIIRKDHVSDNELWDLFRHLSNYIYPRIKRFKEMQKVGYPSVFSEYDENVWDKEEYDKAKESGEIIGGEDKKWDEILDNILFAFEFIKAEENESFRKKIFNKKYEDWHKKTLENKKNHTWFLEKKTGYLRLFNLDEEKPDEELYEKYDSLLNDDFYFNSELYQKYSKRAQEGFELLGKFFTSLWD